MVDVQLEQFEQLFRDDFTCQLVVGINRRYWEEMDELDRETREVIHLMIRYTMTDLNMRYHGTAVEPILEDLYSMMCLAADVALNVPFPRNYILHIDAVVNNLLEMYVRTTYANLRTEMVMVNHAAGVIQRNWRRCVTDPQYQVCRNRLDWEFKNLGNN